jgi:hypothetical protein
MSQELEKKRSRVVSFSTSNDGEGEDQDSDYSDSNDLLKRIPNGGGAGQQLRDDQETLRRIERILYNKRRPSRDEQKNSEKQFHTAPSTTH